MAEIIKVSDLSKEKSLIDIYTDPLEYMTIDELSELRDRISVTIFLKQIREAIVKIKAFKNKNS